MKRNRCVGAGMQLQRWADQYGKAEYKATPMFPENVLLPADDMVVPHSELAMRTRAAGKPITAWACRHNGRSCAIVWGESGDGCGFTDGLPSEVLGPRLLRALQRGHGYNFGLAGLRRRSRRR